jgi:hypothetical protein
MSSLGGHVKWEYIDSDEIWASTLTSGVILLTQPPEVMHLMAGNLLEAASKRDPTYHNYVDRIQSSAIYDF